MLAINAIKAITRVRRRVQDTGSVAYTDAEVLEAIDDALSPIFTTVRMSGQQNELELLSIPVGSLTALGNEIRETVLPETVAEIQLVQGEDAAGRTVPFLKAAHLMEMDLARGNRGIRQPIWLFSRHGRPGRIQIRGTLTPIVQVNIWYVRRWPPLHYGTASAGGASTITFPAAPTGDLSLRDDTYIGMDVEIVADSGAPANVGAMRRVSDYVGSTRVATFESAWPAATSATTAYALVVPLDAEHVEYLVEEAAYKLYEMLAETDNMAAMEVRRRRLEERFLSGLRRRHGQEPLRMWSSRR